MTLSEAGLDLIKTSEGFSDMVYKDPVGNPTIGFGHMLTSMESYPNGITLDQAFELLESDVAWAENVVNRVVKVPISQGIFDALVDFTYNVGAANLAISTLLKELNAGNYFAAGQQLLRWCTSGGVPVPGLLVRRQAELKLWSQT